MDHWWRCRTRARQESRCWCRSRFGPCGALACPASTTPASVRFPGVLICRSAQLRICVHVSIVKVCQRIEAYFSALAVCIYFTTNPAPSNVTRLLCPGLSASTVVTVHS